MKEQLSNRKIKLFCKGCLHGLHPIQAAQAAGIKDLLALLELEQVQQLLRRGREAMGLGLGKEDVLWKLAQLAFGDMGDAAVLLTVSPAEQLPAQLDLSAVSEFKRGSSGAVEVKLVDRVKALQTLYELLGSQSEPEGLAEFFRAMEE